MPCSDISETGLAVFGSHQHLVSYELFKTTCGAPIRGQRSVSRYLKDKNLDELASMNLPEIEAFFPQGMKLINFDDYKAAVSLCELSRLFLGKNPLTRHTSVFINEISYEEDGSLSLYHEILFPKDLPIEACGSGCKTGSCSSQKTAVISR